MILEYFDKLNKLDETWELEEVFETHDELNQQLFDNISQNADKIIETELADAPDEVKTEFKRIYIRSHLSTYLDYDSIERMIQTAEINVETKKDPKAEESSDDENMDDYM